ncbi:O-methyltransferase [Colletotrichum sublineola]|uniref:Putative O-methyltransferase n=1 Tax=Colletotrichum sublineola TaxID=1173701 RepID=A0A066XAC7_COLSU|nr:O-methyltransferase [Colletotrichum sublineola]KDN66118.1 putative O-methyltransferase [Colletotrichum sublineola]
MSLSTSSAGPSKGKVTLAGAEETLLLTLLARAQDAESPHPILSDQYAVDLVSQIEDQGYNFKRTVEGGLAPRRFAHSVATRGRMLDICTEKFLRRHSGPATVLHLACGLDTRSMRIRWRGEGRLWIDADLKEAVKLRQELIKDLDPGRGAGEYRLLEADIREKEWLSKHNIPTDRPVLILFEGLTPYVTPDEFYSFLQQTVNCFHQSGVHGEIYFDALGSLLYHIINYRFEGALKVMGARVSYYLDDPKTLEQKVAGLKFKERVFQTLDLHKTGLLGKVLVLFGWLIDLFGLSGRIGGGYGYEF